MGRVAAAAGAAGVLLAVCFALAGCGSQVASPAWTPTLHVSVDPVPALPSFYDAVTLHANYVVGRNRPWTITKQSFDGHALRRFSIPSVSRPKIIYVMPRALAVLVTQPSPSELLLNTRSARLVSLWRLPRSVSLFPASMGGYGGHTFFFLTTAGVQGPVAAYGAYDVVRGRRYKMVLAQMEGAWYEDLGHRVLFRIKRNHVSQWQHGRWVSQGYVPADPVDAISQQSWIMTVTPERGQALILRWSNVESGVGATERVKGTLEASGADWALVLRGSTLRLAIPSQRSQRVVARSVMNPLTANDAVYWTTPRGGVERVVVSSQAISAVPNIMWP